MMAATNAVFDEARLKKEPHGIILTTTSGKKDDKDGKFIYELVCDAMAWTEKLFDCKNEDDLRRTVKLGSRKNDYMVNITINHRQLGKTDFYYSTKRYTTVWW